MISRKATQRHKACLRRICLLIESYYPIIGGGETQARIMAEDLTAKGFNVIVVTRQSNASLQRCEIINDTTIHRVRPSGNGHLKKWQLLLTCVPTLITLARQFDLLFVSGFRALGVPGILVCKVFGKVCILKADNNGEMSGQFFEGGLQRLGLSLASVSVKLFLKVRNSILKRADVFVSLSSEITNELIYHGVTPGKIVPIPNSVDMDKFCPVSRMQRAGLRRRLGLPLDKVVVIFTGRLMVTKGLPLLLRVWKKIQAGHQVHLVIVGAGSKDIHDCELELKSYVASNRLGTNVQFTGNVSNVHEYLQASDVFVFPTENEAFGISLIEAMACGLPVIATSTGGIKDIVDHGRTGLLVNPNCFNQLFRALDSLMKDNVLRGYLGEEARREVLQKYSRHEVSRRYIELFENVGR